MRSIALIGTGFVADLYMPSIRLYPDVEIVGAYDLRPDRLATFCSHHGLRAFQSVEELFEALPRGGVVLNLTNPDAHYDVSRAALEAGHHVYSEKPLAMRMDQAQALVDLAAERDLMIGGAPCSFLSEAAQTLATAVRSDVAGRALLVYAEMDDDYIPQAPYKLWLSETGAPWPYEDEFAVGCTMEHAGYYLTWLVMMFGPVRTVVAASAGLAPKETDPAPAAADFSVGVLYFESGMVARLTCSILAPHDHSIKIIGERGVIEMEECWHNLSPVRFRKRFKIRRRLVSSPMPRRLRVPGKTHPSPGRRGSATMNFFLGPDEMLNAAAEGRRPRVAADLALHVNEITLALQNAGEHGGAQPMESRCAPVEPMPWAPAVLGRGSKKMRIGIAGTGGMAARMMRAMASTGGFAVSAVLSGDAARAGAFARDMGVDRSFDDPDAFAASGLDAVYVATTPGRHRAAAEAAIRAGLPILIEKPLTASLDDTNALLDAASQSLVVEALWTLTLPVWRDLHAAIDAGQVGAARHMQFDFSYPVAPSGIPSLFAPDGGVLLDRGIYGVAAALDLFGPVADQQSMVVRDDAGIDVRAALLLRHESGQTSGITVSVDGAGPNGLVVTAEEGVLRLGPTSLAAETLSVEHVPVLRERESTVVTPGLKDRLKGIGAVRRLKSMTSGPRLQTSGYGADQYAPILRHFSELVAQGAHESTLIPHALSRNVARILETARTAG